MSTQNTFQYTQQVYAQAAGTTGTNGTLIFTRDPTSNDVNYKIGQIWQNTSANNLWYLNSFTSSGGILQANWTNIVAGGTSIDSLAVQTGTSPVTPTAAGLVTINGAVVAAGTNPVRTDGTGANTMAVEVQTSQAIASTNANNIGLSAFNSAHFSVDANGFVGLVGGGQAIDSFIPDTGTSPVVPTAAGAVTMTGGNGIQTTGGTNTLTFAMESPFTGDFIFSDNASGSTEILGVVNGSNTASSDAAITATVAGTSAGDPYFQSIITGGQTWSFGADNSASDAFVISASAAIGTSNAVSISTAGVVTLPTAPLPVGSGGLGITTTPTNGQIPIGNGTNYTAATITAGNNINVTNGAGSVTVATQVPLTATIAANADGTYTLAIASANNSITGMFNIGWTGTDRVHSITFLCDTVNFDNAASSLTVLSNNSYLAQDVFSNLKVVSQNSNNNHYLQVDVGNRNGSSGNITIYWYGNLNYAPTLAPSAPGASTTVPTYGLLETTAGVYSAGGGTFSLSSNLSLSTAGNKISITTGANASAGTSGAMVAGAVTVNTTAVTANSLFFFATNTLGTITLPASYYVNRASIVPGTSFVITSNQVTDTSTVDYWIIN